ncbi:hypothetical protein YC2023_032783 [Brassica napus]
MGLMRSILPNANQIFKLQSMRNRKGSPSSTTTSGLVPKGHVAVYVGEGLEKKRFVVPISYLNNPLFRELVVLTVLMKLLVLTFYEENYRKFSCGWVTHRPKATIFKS